MSQQLETVSTSGPGTWYEPNDILFLTGAGFTKPYGGYLATEIWAAILNQVEIQKDPKLRDDILKDFNYESFYHRVQSSKEYSQTQKNALTEAIRKAYASMDDIIAELDSRARELAHGVCKCILRRFAGEGKKRGFLFTLNQDLFIERFYGNDDHTRAVSIPGIIQDPKWFRSDDRFKIDSSSSITLPNDAELDKRTKNFWDKGTGQFKYIKLHGSYNWRSYDASNVIVIGEEKEGMIEKEPLLRWYKKVFREVLLWPKKKILVVIGYSFRDSHINQAIADAVQAQLLHLCIVSPQSPQEFHNELLGLQRFNVEPKPHAAHVWSSIRQYWPNTVSEFYDPKQPNLLPPKGNAFFDGLRDSIKTF